MDPRIGEIKRITKETEITARINLDGTGECRIDTGIPFFDHMLNGFARHGLFDLDLKCRGDVDVDSHHTIEDSGIVLGQAVLKALGDKKGIKRYGYFILPMDEALVMSAADMSGRPYLSFDMNFTVPKIGDMDTEMVHDFFYAFSYSAMMNLHIRELSGSNNHHIAEAAFKAFGKALDAATQIEERLGDSVWSTKEML